ncbi:MAG: DUF4384 domain-containing protein [Deltaproteobacteria bacterium]|nr:DUF4384 domain-containing protein [Deltaproteobacteria bacterium]
MNRNLWGLVVLGCVSCGGGGPAPETAAPAPVAQPTPDPAAEPAGPVKLSFRVHAKDGQSVRAIAPGETLRSGDKIALSLDLDQRAYLYVVQYFADGTAAVLFPQGDEQNRLVGVTRIPSRGWFRLDDNTGEENVYVVASVRPLKEAEETIMQTLNSVRVSGANPSEEPPPDTGGNEAASPPAAENGTKGTEPKKPTKRPKKPTKRPKKPAKRPKKPTKRPKKPGKRPRKERPPMLSHATRAGLTTRGLQRVSDEGDSIEATTDSAGIAIVRFYFQHR